MPENLGKKFEDRIRQALESIPDTSVDRLPDQMSGYAGSSNVADFIAYRYPYQFYIECKSCHGNTLSIHSNDQKKKYGAISNVQWEGMLNKSRILGVYAGIICWFIDHNETWYIPIASLEGHRQSGNKSLSVGDVSTLPGVVNITAIKRRVFFDYDLSDIIRRR